MLRPTGLSLLTLVIAFSVDAEAQSSVKEGLRRVSGLADEVSGRAQFIEQQFRKKSMGVEERGRKARLENGEVLFLLKIDELKVLNAEKSQNYQKIISEIINKNNGLYFNNEIFVIQRKS